MALTIVSTPGATNANSYQEVTDIDAYYAARVPASVSALWLNAAAEDKKAAAIMSTTWMDSLICWTGYVTDPEQSLLWPRQGMLERNEFNYVPYTDVPQEVKNLQAEFARVLLLADRSAESDISAQGINFLKVGPVTLKFRDYTPGPPILPSLIISLLVPSWVDYIRDQIFTERELQRA